MTFEPRLYETTIATLVRVRPDLVEIRYKPGSMLTVEHMTEVQKMRRTIMGHAPYAMLTFIPGDVDFQMNTMRTDHMAADRIQSQVIATAVVAEANMIEMLVKLYFSYFPQLQRIRVTDNEGEARAWLSEQLEENARTGS